MAEGANGRVALVTGASRGIGRAAALGLADAGFDVVVNDIARQAAELEAVRGEIEARGRRGFTALADVSRKDEVRAMAAQVLAEAGRVDALVNNAGILIANGVEDLGEEQWDAVLDVNAKGTFLVSTASRPIACAPASSSPRWDEPISRIRPTWISGWASRRCGASASPQTSRARSRSWPPTLRRS